MLKSFLLLFSFSLFIGFSQDYDFSKSWTFLGPDEKPQEDRRQAATGIGPVDHIDMHPLNSKAMLCSSINGGLFFTKDGGEQWINSGSDDWDYSGCSMALYHPLKESVWFASSCLNNPNGSAGTIGKQGGVYRTLDEGNNWELVGDKSSFINSGFLTIHGMKFHPNKPNVLFVYTTEGVYYTVNCLASDIQWKRVDGLKGWIFDLEFTENDVYFTHMQFGKWSIYSAPLNDLSAYKRLAISDQIIDDVEGITIEISAGRPLILVNYLRKGDELLGYNPQTQKTELILKSQRVIFGKGATFAVSPHDPDEIIVGYGTTMKRWDIPTKSQKRMKGGYHVDIEYVIYDHADSNKIIIATHGGVYISEDRGESWTSKSKGIGIAEVEGLAVSRKDHNQMAIGCFHDGSTVRADFNNDGLYTWKNVNGGDGLVPLMPANDPSIVYTSNQYNGGGMFYSADTGRTKTNLHTLNSVITSGWQMAAVLHPEEQDLLFFNFEIPSGSGKGNIEIGRTNTPLERKSVDRVTNFKVSHGIEKYSIYGVFNSPEFPDVLYAHMIQFVKDENDKQINVHRLWKTEKARAKDSVIIHSWYELEIPRDDWIADVIPDKKSHDRIQIAYVSGVYGADDSGEDYGLIYSLKYKKSTKKMKKEIDISENLPYSFTGRFNLVEDGSGGVFFATRSGIYYANKKTLKGKRDWVKIGFGSPHCKVHGLDYNPELRELTVGYYGRGVWRYNL
ncbi:MAG: hypothetical protein ABJG68_16715 [Crocinitomicaceae bacterium]